MSKPQKGLSERIRIYMDSAMREHELPSQNSEAYWLLKDSANVIESLCKQLTDAEAYAGSLHYEIGAANDELARLAQGRVYKAAWELMREDRDKWQALATDFEHQQELRDYDELYNEDDGQPDEAQEWHDFDPDC
jgi:hypothetical protein